MNNITPARNNPSRRLSRSIRQAPALIATVCATITAADAGSPVILIKEGRPAAQIVTAENPTRSVRLAAQELQNYLEKISGARLDITTTPAPPPLANIFIGSSAGTGKLGLSDEGLVDGAFRMVSGDNWLALLGNDEDFVPPEPWARNAPQARDPEHIAQWDRLTGATWDNPVGNPMSRKYSKKLDLWEQDGKGSLNAVYALLRGLGVEWYMPGELGEILPRLDTVQVGPLDTTVRPDFALRYHHGTPFGHDLVDDILWNLRLGLNSTSELTGEALVALSHGMRYAHSRPEAKQKYPEFFALRGGKRATELNQPDLSSEELFDEHVRFVRFLFDHYNLPMVSIFPEDGAVYSEDEISAAQETPERGWLGSHSDYVWGYVDRVAREVYKSHPDRLVSSFAYANYALPPLKIDKLSPNLVVGLLQYRFYPEDSERRKSYLELRREWREKLGNDQPFLLWTHYPFNAPGRGWHGIPAYFPRRIAGDLHSLRGISHGELVEVMFDPSRSGGLYAPGFNHLNSFVTARMYWDATADIDQLLDRYYADFYGPAAAAMQEFIEHGETNLPDFKKDAEIIEESLRLLQAAREQAPDGSVYAQRIDLVSEYVEPMRELAAQLRRGRENIPKFAIAEIANPEIRIDGKIDEAVWQQLPAALTLVQVKSGEPAKHPATVRMFWADNALFIGIRCSDPDAQNLAIAGARNGDRSIWNGDHVEVMLETNNHSFYQLAINPAGHFIDLDRAGGINADWASGATVAATTDSEGWSVEIKIPIAAPGHVDPLNMMIGSKPDADAPWFANFCRIRPRADETELTAWSPTGEDHFQDISRFGELIVIPAGDTRNAPR